MEIPAVRYVRSFDGATIAYVDEGVGTAVLSIRPFSHLLGEHELRPERNDENEFMTARYRFLRMDARGSGASQRGLEDYSVSARASDIGAVLDAAAVETAVLWGHLGMTPPVVKYAAEHPDRVDGLVLGSPTRRMADAWKAHPHISATNAVGLADWRLWAQSESVAVGRRGDDIDRAADWTTACWNQGDWYAFWTQAQGFDISEYLPRMAAQRW